jgi:predicted dehydrogenase
MATPHPGPLSRRTFVKGAAATAASIPFVMSKVAHAIPLSDPDVLKVGLIGCGGRGTGAAFQAISAENGTVRLTAMADAFADRLESSLTNLKSSLGEERAALADVDPEHRFVGFDAYRQVIDSGVDVVILATPPHFRPEHLRAAIEADKHVFTEKPVAVDGPGVRSVLETAALAKQKRLNLVSGFCWRYNVRHREFYKRIHEDALGELRSVYSTYNAGPLGVNKRRPEWSEMEFQMRNWQHFCWLAGDHIVEQAIHSLDKMAWTMQDAPPLSVTAIGGRQAREGEERGNIYDHFSATFEYEGGVKGLHMCRQIANCSNDNSDHVFGEKGTAHIDTGGWNHRILTAEPWAYEGEGNDMYQQEHDELFAAIRKGEPMNDGVWMTHSTLLAIMARMSAYTGQTITWEQALNSTERLGPESCEWGDLELDPVPIPGRTQFA